MLMNLSSLKLYKFEFIWFSLFMSPTFMVVYVLAIAMGAFCFKRNISHCKVDLQQKRKRVPNRKCYFSWDKMMSLTM